MGEGQSRLLPRACPQGIMETTSKGDEAARLREVQGDTWKGDNPEECPVCMTTFDDVVQRPRNLPCGHTFCTSCINGLKEQGQVTCPTCRFKHVVPKSGQFPISYITEAFVNRQRGAVSASLPPKTGKYTRESAPSSLGRSSLMEVARLSSPIRSMVQEQEKKVLATISSCQELHWQLNQYETTLAVWSEQQQHLEDRLQALVDRSKSARLLVRQEETQVAAKKEQVHRGEQQQHTVLQTLRTAATRQEAFEAIDDADHLTEEERQRTEEWRETFPDVHTVTTIRKVRVVLRAALKAAQTVEEALDREDTESAPGDGAEDTGGAPVDGADDTKGAPTDGGDTEGTSVDGERDASLPTASPVTITGRLEDLLAPTLEAEDLRRLTQPATSLLEAGRVFATHKVEGQSRHARISLEDGRLFLHSLRDQPLPSGAATLQVDEVVPASPPCLVFLDFEWPGSATRRVLLRLSPDTPLGRQFIWLCTGQQGPCYANTLLFQVKYSGEPGERVSGGDYERNNGKGGAPLLPDLDKGEYLMSCQAGAVYPVWRGGDKSEWNSRFGILTKDLEEEGAAVNTVFGEVEGGFEVVTEAAQHSPITEVTVVDCGVVLWE